MQTALNLLGAMLILDLLAAFGLIGLVALVGQRGHRRETIRAMRGPFLYLTVCLLFVYGSLWLIFRHV